MVLLSGEAGLGKTRLLREFCLRLADDGAKFAFATCLEYARAPLAPIADALRTLLSGRPGVLEAIPERARALARLVPDLALQDPTLHGEELDKAHLFESVAAVLHRLSANDTHVLIVDDIQWADPATLQLLQYVSRYVLSARLLLVLAFRDEEERGNSHVWSAISYFEREPYTWRMALEPLDDTQMLAVLRSALAGRVNLAPETIERIREAAEGSPLNAEELLKSVIENRSAKHDIAVLPITLRESILERLDRLDDEERDALLCASVIGRRFEPQFLAQTLQRDLHEVTGALRKGVAMQLLVEEPGDTVLYAFRHALTREAIYEQLLAIDARPLHARIAQELEAREDAGRHVAELAYHYWAAGEPEKSVHYNRLAGDRALELCAYSDAARSYERALSAATKIGVPATDIDAKLAIALDGEGETALALEHTIAAQASYERAGDYERAADCSYNAIRLYQKTGDAQAMQRATARTLELAARNPQSRTNFVAHMQLAWDQVAHRDGAKAMATLKAASELEALAEPADLVRFHVIRGAAASQQDDAAPVVEAFEQAVGIAREAGDASRLAMAYQNFANFAAFVGLRDRAVAAIDAACDVIHTHHLGNDRAIWTLSDIAESAFFMGMLREARDLVREALNYPTAAAAMRFDTIATAAQTARMLQDEPLLKATADDAFFDAAQTFAHDAQWVKVAYTAADLLYDSGRAEAAQQLLRRAIEAAGESIWLDAVPELCVRVARFGAADDVSRARSHLKAGTGRGRLQVAYEGLFEAYACSRTEKHGAREHAETAARVFAQLQLPLHAARALEASGKHREALALYRENGDRYDAVRLERALWPVNRLGRAKDALTAREREIAALIAVGRSNASIAESLSLSERTVEHHVTAIFSKLRVNSRAEVAAYITREQLAKA